jgi:leucyl aminopeptidase
VTSTNGFASAVSLGCAGLPAGATCAYSPGSVTPPANGSASATLTVSVAASTATGTYNFTAVGTSGALTRSADLSLTVTGTGPGDVMAAFDSTLQTPRCATVGRSCDSGPSLLLGRAALGPEPNQPNTINDSCADGASGTFHADESNDRIKVSTTDGTALAPGKTVRIDATVWAWTTPAQDKLDLYYAANANSPTWTFITTLTPAAAGAQTLSATYTLPSGALQAVRARFRYQGSAAACGAGSYNDHDDLIFAVNP